MTNSRKTVSVVMATYNGEKYIREQLDSVIAQTYPISELIIQDDCSTDKTVEICREYEKKYSFVHVFVNTENAGFRDNFQEALSKCGDTEYVAFCDQDDIWTSDHVEHLFSIIGSKPLACADSILVDSGGQPLGMTLSQQQRFSFVDPNDTMKALTIFLWRNPYQGSAMLVRKDFLETALPFPDGVGFHDTWMASLACFMGGISYSSHPISYYRIHSDNASGSRLKPLFRLGAFRVRLCGFKCDDRLPMIEVIESRVPDLSKKERGFLQRMKQYFRKESMEQKILNAVYLIIHARSVFTI